MAGKLDYFFFKEKQSRIDVSLLNLAFERVQHHRLEAGELTQRPSVEQMTHREFRLLCRHLHLSGKAGSGMKIVSKP